MNVILSLSFPDGSLSVATSEDSDAIQVAVAVVGRWLYGTESIGGLVTVEPGYYELSSYDAEEVADAARYLQADGLCRIADVLMGLEGHEEVATS